MKRRTLIKGITATLPSLWQSRALGNNFFEGQYLSEPIAEGPFKPTWESLQNYKGDALFGTAMGWPEDGKLVIKTLAKNGEPFPKEIQKIEWLPTKQSLIFERNENGLIVSFTPKTF
ncbi:MAG: hypothetical protein ACXWV6_08850 [Chitinophagaceae bacterium]